MKWSSLVTGKGGWIVVMNITGYTEWSSENDKRGGKKISTPYFSKLVELCDMISTSPNFLN